MLQNSIQSTNKSVAKNPIVLLKQSEFETIRHNAVILKKMKIINPNSLCRKVIYEKFKIGSNLQIVKKQKSHCIDLQKSAARYFYILTSLCEFKTSDCKIQIYLSNGRSIIDSDIQNYSGYVVLCYGCHYQFPKKEQKIFTNDDNKMIEHTSKNQVKATKKFHFETKGKIYSFGYAPKFCKIGNDGCSFKKFVPSKKSTLTEKTKEYYLKHFERTLAEEFVSTIEKMKRYFPNIKNILSPSISLLQSHFDTFGTNIKSQNLSHFVNNGLINMHYCINTETMQYHTEQDQSYTIIAVPQQVQNNQQKRQGANFEFFINEENILLVEMFPNTSFMYSGYLLTHRQQLMKEEYKNNLFINISTYCSKRLYDNMMKSFQRKILKPSES